MNLCETVVLQMIPSAQRHVRCCRPIACEAEGISRGCVTVQHGRRFDELFAVTTSLALERVVRLARGFLDWIRSPIVSG